MIMRSYGCRATMDLSVRCLGLLVLAQLGKSLMIIAALALQQGLGLHSQYNIGEAPTH